MQPKQPKKHEPALDLSQFTLEEAIKRAAAYKPPRKPTKRKTDTAPHPKNPRGMDEQSSEVSTCP